MATPDTNQNESKKQKTPIGDKKPRTEKQIQDPEIEDQEDADMSSSEGADDMPNDEKWEGGKQVRGSELRGKMEESEQDGKDYRALHQGKDIRQDNFKTDKQYKD